MSVYQRLNAWIAAQIVPFATADGPPPKTVWRFINWALKGSGKVLLAGAGVSVAAGVTEVVSAVLLGLVIDWAVAGGDLWAAHGWAFIAIGLFLLVIRPVAFGMNASAQAVAIAPALNVLILSRLHRWTLGQAVTFFDNDFAGRIAQKQMQTARALTDVVTEFLNTVVFAVSSIIATLVLVIAIDWRIAVVLGVWMIGYFWFIRHYMPKIRERAEARAGARAQVTGVVVDTISNMRTVKLFAHDRFEDQAAVRSMDVYRRETLDFGIVSATFRFWLMALAGILPVTMVGLALYFSAKGTATPGDIAATGTVALRIAQMSGWVSFTLMGMYSNIGEVEDGMHTLTPSHSLVDSPGAVPLSGGNSVEYDDVSFAYGRQTGGVEHIRLSIKPGEKIGLVGASGAGKSSLVSLLLRLYDTETGAVRVGGQDVRDVTQDSLRRNIGMVTQETAMFNRSARDNIRYGRPEANEAEVIAAAEKAEAHEFILDLQDFKGRKGYDAHLGERGVKLSGGQRQRIALARAMLKDAPILVLDEATSALDSEVEASIQSALDIAMQGKTVIAIAHRLSTIASMDRIIVLDQGRIVEEGTHELLLARGGLYARYWNRQSGGFLRTEAAE
jgi:ATP-binding cassette, subfamily B, bacterial